MIIVNKLLITTSNPIIVRIYIVDNYLNIFTSDNILPLISVSSKVRFQPLKIIIS